jgi:hypothetical protein
MRKLIVSNLVTLDGYYEGKDKSINSLYDYYHEDYAGDDSFDFYNAERLRAADFLLLSRNAFLGNKGYWTGVVVVRNSSWRLTRTCRCRDMDTEIAADLQKTQNIEHAIVVAPLTIRELCIPKRLNKGLANFRVRCQRSRSRHGSQAGGMIA